MADKILLIGAGMSGKLIAHQLHKKGTEIILVDPLKIKDSVSTAKSRCCGRCDGVNDLCVSDMVCEAHKVMGCEICYGVR